MKSTADVIARIDQVAIPLGASFASIGLQHLFIFCAPAASVIHFVHNLDNKTLAQFLRALAAKLSAQAAELDRQPIILPPGAKRS